MKRDMDLVRALLLEIESQPAGVLYDTADSAITGFDRTTIDEHLRLMHEAGLLSGFAEELAGAHCAGLSWQGHEFLAAARSDRVWSAAKQRLLKAGMSGSLAVMKDLLVAVARQQLGLP